MIISDLGYSNEEQSLILSLWDDESAAEFAASEKRKVKEAKSHKQRELVRH